MWYSHQRTMIIIDRDVVFISIHKNSVEKELTRPESYIHVDPEEGIYPPQSELLGLFRHTWNKSGTQRSQESIEISLRVYPPHSIYWRLHTALNVVQYVGPSISYEVDYLVRNQPRGSDWYQSLNQAGDDSCMIILPLRLKNIHSFCIFISLFPAISLNVTDAFTCRLSSQTKTWSLV